MNTDVDKHIANAKLWPQELDALRNIMLECGLEEVYKWKQPCYQYKSKNLIILGEFKEACIISFLNGALLKDTNKLLHKPGEHTQSGRFMKFTKTTEIKKQTATIKAYVYEAMQVQDLGIKLDTTESKQIALPAELLDVFKKDKELKKSFEALTPGRQRAYLMHFTGAKQSATVTDRINKYTKRIKMGKGIMDCVCGLSKKMPNCDGSHKLLNTKLDF
jgi:uncharacterized protein YdeI (YjbR/CyaY-like superfamily)